MRIVADVIIALSYAGVGAAVGSIGAAVVNSRSGKSEARAHAADLITDAAGALADKQATVIERLEKRTDKQAKAIIALTTVVDELLASVQIAAAERVKLQKVVDAARLAIY